MTPRQLLHSSDRPVKTCCWDASGIINIVKSCHNHTLQAPVFARLSPNESWAGVGVCVGLGWQMEKNPPPVEVVRCTIHLPRSGAKKGLILWLELGLGRVGIGFGIRESWGWN